jgi:hypothetical protein
VHTTDGGKSFISTVAPPLPEHGTTPMLRFADRRDGVAYVPQARGVLYVTHDGGAHWQRLALGDVLAFTTAAGNAYAVTARCSLQACTHYRFERAPAATDRWTAMPLRFRPDGSLFGLAARGSRVWLLGTRAAKGPMAHDELSRSSDGGRTFVTGQGPCIPGLGGDLRPASATVVWAVCPTGLLAAAWRSTDGALTFRRLNTPPLANAASLAPASARVAVLFANAAGARLMRTSDGGRTWRPARTPQPPTDIQSLSFTSATVGLALVQAGGSQTNALWRTTDGGADWSQVPLR